jgi:hypothetical protein
VGAVEDEDFVYFFFREEAVEFMNCGKVSLEKLFKKIMLVHFFIRYINEKVSVAKAEMDLNFGGIVYGGRGGYWAGLTNGVEKSD